MRLSRRFFLQSASGAALAPLFPRIFFGEESSGLCHKLANDPLRPQYHLLPARNWMNDPNGPIHFKGRYHMFHQYNPQSSVWGNMNWAHATSPDLIHWQHEPIAISPTPDGPDQDGVFSGSAVLDQGKVAMIYTGVAPPANDAAATLRDGVHTWRETQCLAVAQDDDLRTWKKLHDPVIAAPPLGLAVTGFRDPVVWREGDAWMLALGSGVKGSGGMILLYTSTDLRNWKYLHPLLEGSIAATNGTNPVDNGEMWECPDFFPLGDKHVVLISTMGKVLWKVGTYAKQRFTTEKEGVVDWGAYYAAKTQLDKDGNRILWGWIPERRPDVDLLAAGWAGVMSLPRALWLSPANELQMEVIGAAKQLRNTHAGIDRRMKSIERQNALEALRIRNLAAEIRLELHPNDGDCSLNLQSEDGHDFAAISCVNKLSGRELTVNGVTASLSGQADSPLSLQLYLDGSVLEVFANQTTAVTARIYKAPATALCLKVGGKVEIAAFNCWQMKPISKDRLTGSMCA